MASFSIPSIITLLALGAAFFLMWKERHQFQSLFYFRIAVALLVFGRIITLIQAAFIQQAFAGIVWLPAPSNLLLAGIGDMSDAVGLLLLVYGFIKTLQFEREEEELIHNLETLLPLCAWCKKYRTEAGDWKPIEVFLKERGAPNITHGICPECAATKLNAKNRRQPV